MGEAAKEARAEASAVRAAMAEGKRAMMVAKITADRVAQERVRADLEAAQRRQVQTYAAAAEEAANKATEASVTATMKLLKEADIHTRNGNPYNAAIIHGQVVEGAMAAADRALAMSAAAADRVATR